MKIQPSHKRGFFNLGPMRFIYLGLLFIALHSCTDNILETVNYGHAQGTTYSIRYIQDVKNDYQKSIDSILINIDRSMSLWVESSIISKVNRGDSAIELDPHFVKVLKRSIKIGQETNGSEKEWLLLFTLMIGTLILVLGLGFLYFQAVSEMN